MGSSCTKEQQQHAEELIKLVQQNGGRQVSGKELMALLQELDESCPWYPLHGSLKLEVWERIGKELQAEPRAPITCLLTWKVIYEALSVFHGKKKRVEPVAESSREGCVAAGIREAWRTGQIDTTEEWGGGSLCMFPLTRTPAVNAQGQRGYQLNWEPLPYTVLRELNKSARDDAIQSTYFQGMLEGVHNGHLMLPQDWKDMMRMLLTPAQYVIWDSEFKHAALKGQTAAITADQVYGAGQFATVQAQMQLTDQHLNATWMCIQRALRRVPGRSSVTKSFSSIRQGPNEPYTAFIDKLKVAISRQLDNVEAQSELLLKLAYENANTDCKRALQGVIRKEPYELADMLRACAEVGSKAHEMALLAVALRGGKGNCYNCKKPGHFKAECRAPGGGAYRDGGQQRPQKPSRKCPRCGKGYHWASQCRSNPQGNVTAQQGN
ncbi:endogenous retrovirus group K member 7 Gag polyprotein-like [Pogona vitticeps]